MLLVTFRAHEDLFAIDAGRVVEVVPRVDLRRVPHAPSYLAGLLNYRGRIVPVADLGLLLGAQPCRPRLSTRIILVDRAGDERGQAALGLIAESVSEVRAVPGHPEVFPALHLEQAAYLGPIFQVDGDLIQLILVDDVLGGPLREALDRGRSVTDLTGEG